MAQAGTSWGVSASREATIVFPFPDLLGVEEEVVEVVACQGLLLPLSCPCLRKDYTFVFFWSIFFYVLSILLGSSRICLFVGVEQLKKGLEVFWYFQSMLLSVCLCTSSRPLMMKIVLYVRVFSAHDNLSKD